MADDSCRAVIAASRLSDEIASDRFLEPERCVRRAHQLLRALDDLLEHVIQAFGGGEVAAELEQRLRALGLAALRLVETGVLDRNGGVARQHLEQSQVVGVELLQAELRDHDHADHAGAVLHRHGDDRLLDLRGALDLEREFAGGRVVEEQRLAGLDHVSGEALADPGPEDVGRRRGGARQLPLERNRLQLVAVSDEDSAVVVIDQLAELVRDRHADLANVGGPGELARERLKHFQVGDRTDVLAARVRLRPLGRGIVEVDDLALAARLRRHHRGLGASDELARVCGVPRPLGDSDRDRDPPGEIERDFVQPRRKAGRESDRLRLVAVGQDHGEFFAADPADDVGCPDGGAQMVGELGQHVVSDSVSEDVVHLLEVVDVHHHEHDVLVLARCPGQLAAKAFVEVAMVVETGERVCLGLALEPGTDVSVVEGKRRRVAEALRKLELLLREAGVLTDPVDVESALQRATRDQRDDDQRFWLDRRSGHELDAGIEVSLVREDGLPVLDRPAGDADAEGKDVVEDLLGPLAPHEHRDEFLLRLVGLVDVQCLVRDDLIERVRDPNEQRVEALLREEIVEDVREAAVGVD